MDELIIVKLIKIVPKEIWVALIAIAGVIISNKYNRKILFKQLRHSAFENNRDRILELKIGIYNELIESNSYLSSKTLQMFFEQLQMIVAFPVKVEEIPEEGLMQPTDMVNKIIKLFNDENHISKYSRLHVIGSNNVIELTQKLQYGYSKLQIDMVQKLKKFNGYLQNIKSLDKEIESNIDNNTISKDEDVGYLEDRVHKLKFAANYTRWNMLLDFFVLVKRVNAIGRELTLAMREDLELPIDRKRYLHSTEINEQKIIPLAERIKKVKSFSRDRYLEAYIEKKD